MSSRTSNSRNLTIQSNSRHSTAQNQRKMNQREANASAYRLSKPSQKFGNNNSTNSRNVDTYANSFFKAHPDEVDLRPPTEKLEELNNQFEENLEPAEKFNLLMKQKSLRYMVYGDNSKEAMDSHLALGIFYHEQNRPDSAIRHLEKAKELSESGDFEIDEETKLTIAIELCESHLSIRSANKRTDNSHINAAYKKLQPFLNEDIENDHLRMRRDLAKGRIYAAKGRYQQSIEAYEASTQLMNQNSEKTAQVYTEMADVHLNNENEKEAQKCYKKAYEIYKNLGMTDEASQFEDKLPEEEETINEPKENPKEESDQEANEEEEETTPKTEKPSIQYRYMLEMPDAMGDQFGQV